MGLSISELLNEVIENQSYLLYHGSPQEIKNFTDEFVGAEEATDQEGPGIYFTTSYDDALGYAEGDGGYVYTVRVNPRVLFDESEEITIDRDLLVKLVLMSDDWETAASNWSEDARTGVEMLVDSAFEYNDNEKDVLLQIWIEAYRYEGVDYIRNCVKLGIDGVIVNREGNRKHVIIYNPDIIEVREVERVSRD